MTVIRRVFRVRGTVQAVGFRPFVFRVASDLDLRGAVWNDSLGVVIDAEGDPAALQALARAIGEAPPPRANVESLESSDRPVVGYTSFAIRESREADAATVRVPTDLATCTACLAELDDPRDRRHGYPFINCTDCGPRYSIIRDVPYDRPLTTMAAFEMCAACASEYRDPRSRRFHAEPNACPSCGPRLWVHRSDATDPVAAALAALRRGEIVALKGLGGFHLACDARSEAAVHRLRERKRRPHKPFAVMFPDLKRLESAAFVDAQARELLLGPERPIALLPLRDASALASSIAPGLLEVGAFLPYTPLHHLLMRGFDGPLVMTSGNLSEEPICSTNDEALRRLGTIADVVLLHDRDIHMRADDSVVRVGPKGRQVMRRGRGLTPLPIALARPAPDLLAVGADLKSALCVVTADTAILGQHVGDLESLESQEFFAEVRRNLERLFRVRPTLVAHDLHPGYHSTSMARRMGLPLVPVQHHHAHIASCLADNGRSQRVIGVAWDGTGYGPDGSVWGGEFLVADLAAFERVGRIRPVPLAGGDAAVRQPWRMALAHLIEAGAGVERIRAKQRSTVEAMIREGVHTVATSSAGRLFDAVASLLGVRDEVSYEGQAAMEIEALADTEDHELFPLPAVDEGGLIEMDARPLVRAIAAAVAAGVAPGTISARFHATLAHAIADVCTRIREGSRLSTVALSGGCFQNALLTRLTVEALQRAGFEVITHARVPPNDGGLALGQAAVAAWLAGR